MEETFFSSFITSLHSYNNKIIVGLDDGTIRTDEFSFTAHEKEFDTLESVDIPEKVNDFFIVDSGSFHQQFVSCNDKSINVNKVRPNISCIDIIENNYTKESLSYRAECTSSLKNIHNYNIESLSYSNDYFISTDYLRINLWNIHNLSHSYNLLDCKPKKLEEMEYVITKGLLMNDSFSYGTSNGEVFINDLRIKSTNQNKIVIPKSEDLYEEILRMIHDYLIIENNLIIRDMNTVYFYDLRMNDCFNRIIFDGLSIDYIEKHFKTNSFGNFKLSTDKHNFFSGGGEGILYKIDNQYNLFSIDLKSEESLELVCNNNNDLFCSIGKSLMKIDDSYFKEVKKNI